VIAHESGVTVAPDPLGGSYVIEELTARLEREATDYIRRIDEMGGTLRAIETGFIQSEIQNAAFEFQKGVESGKNVIVGVNRFQSGEKEKTPVFRVDPAIEQSQIKQVRAVRASRDATAWKGALADLQAAAEGTENLMPRILAAAEAMATVGEISDTLRAVFGEYRDA